MQIRQAGANAVHRLDDIGFRQLADHQQNRRFGVGHPGVAHILYRIGDVSDIAQSHRLASRPEKALEFYRLYLEKSPDAKNRPEIEERIATLEKQLGIGGFPKMIVPDVPEGPEPAPADLVKLNGGKRSGAKTAGIVLGVIGGAAVIGTAIGLGIYFGTQNNTPVTVFQPVMP